MARSAAPDDAETVVCLKNKLGVAQPEREVVVRIDARVRIGVRGTRGR